VLAALLSFFPGPVLGVLRFLIRVLTALRFPVTSAMAFATVPFAGWLVGPARVEREPYTEDELADAGLSSGAALAVAAGPLYSRVVLRKCRYLEASGCKSACVNICKVPTQTFFAEKLGIPLHMKPDFESKECALCFGQPAPPLALDPAVTGACYADCAWTAQRAARDNKGPSTPLGCSSPDGTML